MKYFIGIVLLLGISVRAQTQEHYLSLNFGASQPLGDYAKSEDLASHGFARNGGVADFFGALGVIDYFSIAGNLKFTSNYLQEEAHKDALKEIIPPIYNGEISDYAVGFWKNVAFLVGPQVNLPIGKLRIDGHVLAGLNVAMAPTIDVQVVQGTNQYDFRFSGQQASFGMDAGLALRYNLNSKYAFRFAMDYFLSKIDGEYETRNTVDGSFNKENYSIQIHNSQLTVGIAYRL